jgi:hypothetical protein
MSYDRNRSPVGWYVASYLLRFIELGAAGNNNPRRKFLSWENTVVVKAKSLEHAYEKVAKLGRAHSKPYRGGPNRVPVRWVFEGITELLPIYEEIEDGSEIMWAQRSPKMLKTLRRLVRPKSAFRDSRSAGRPDELHIHLKLGSIGPEIRARNKDAGPLV